MNRRKIGGATISVLNASNLQLECAVVMNEGLPFPALVHVSETIVRTEKDLGLRLYRWITLEVC